MPRDDSRRSQPPLDSGCNEARRLAALLGGGQQGRQPQRLLCPPHHPMRQRRPGGRVGDGAALSDGRPCEFSFPRRGGKPRPRSEGPPREPEAGLRRTSGIACGVFVERARGDVAGTAPGGRSGGSSRWEAADGNRGAALALRLAGRERLDSDAPARAATRDRKRLVLAHLLLAHRVWAPAERISGGVTWQPDFFAASATNVAIAG